MRKHPDYKKIKRRVKSHKKAKRIFIFKKAFEILIVFLVIAFLGFLAYKNIAPFGDVIEIEYSIGGDSILKPESRVSENLFQDNKSYVNLKSGLVYFDLSIPRGTEDIEVEVNFNDSFPDNYVFTLGARDKEEWHYKTKLLYSKVLENFNYINNGSLRLYQINGDYKDVNNFLDNLPEDKVISTYGYKLDNQVIKQEVIKEDLDIQTNLRGSHTFFTYFEGDLELEISKRDLNWYNSTDELVINVYNGKDNLIYNGTISDDGNESESKLKGQLQVKNIKILNLKEDLYRIELVNNADLIITGIKTNSGKLVVKNHIFLADNDLYFNNKTSKIYFKGSKQLSFLTYHDLAKQKIYVNDNILDFDKIKEKVNFEINGTAEIAPEKSDIIIDGMGYFSFTEDSYFEPYKYKITNYKEDYEFIKNNVDYILVEYNGVKGDQWKTGKANFNLDDDNLYLKDNKLSLVLNAGHLTNEELINNTVAIDYIKIKIIKPRLI